MSEQSAAIAVKPKRKRLGKRNRPERLRSAAIGIILPASILLLWQWSASQGWLDEMFLPAPTKIISAFGELAASGELPVHLAISLRRAIAGFLAGGVLGWLLGILTGFSRRVEKYVDPSLQLLRLTPSLALAPLFILWFGFGEASKIVIIANVAFFPLYLNTFLGIRNADSRLVEVSRVLEFSPIGRIVKVFLPAALPNILLGLRLSLAGAWLGLVVAEIIGSDSGVGYLITFGQANNKTEIVFAGVIIFTVVGKLVDSLVRLLERKWLAWKDNLKL